MNKKMMKVGKVIADMSLAVTKANVNSGCLFVYHQPKLPKGAEKLKR